MASANLVIGTELADRLELHENHLNAEDALAVGGEVWDGREVLLIYSHPELGTGLNFASRVRANNDELEDVVEYAAEWFVRRGVQPHFRVSPLTRPPDLARILERRGFVQTEAETQMVLAAEDVAPPPNPHVTVEPVEFEKLELWAKVQHRGFSVAEVASPFTIRMVRAAMIQHRAVPYLARLDGESLGAGVRVEFEGVHGIYGVSTLPQVRTAGVGTALLRKMIRDARAYRDAPICLQVETGSRTLHWYERLGFRVVYDRTGWTLKIGG